MAANVMVLFGSGGHSTEMLMLIQNAKLRKKLDSDCIDKLTFLISEDDSLICDKIDSEFSNLKNTSISKLKKISMKRARRVGQSYVTAVWTFLISFLQSINIVLKHRPSFCLTNGPAISVTILLAIRCLQILTCGFYYKCYIIYIESFCRTKSLSFSGKLIYHLRLANKFYVQWPDLCVLYPSAIYKGLLV